MLKTVQITKYFKVNYSNIAQALKKKKNLPIITCKRPEFNLYSNSPLSRNAKFRSLPLASDGWKHRKSVGDYFIIHPLQDLESNAESTKSFESLGVNKSLVDNLRKAGIEYPTKYQTEGIPAVLSGGHTLLAAETGCGKTYAFLIPIIQQMLERKLNEKTRNFNTPQVLIVTPGRELAHQIGHVAESLVEGLNIKTRVIVGGRTKQQMLNPTFEDVDILVASFGAISKLVTTGIYRMHEVKWVVLDEADTLLDDSFTEKLGYFLRKFPFYKNHLQDLNIAGSQLILAAATMPNDVDEMLGQIVNPESMEKVVSENLHRIMPHVPQRFMRMNKSDRPAILLDFVRKEVKKKKPTIIFSNKSTSCDYVSIFLNDNGVNCVNLNGDMLMKIRVGQFEKFQSGEVDVLSTTDVGSRGLDTARAVNVINFDFPLYTADYIHRCGRIGRVGGVQDCLVTNFVSSLREVDLVQRTEHVARTTSILPKVNANITNIIQNRILENIQKTV